MAATRSPSPPSGTAQARARRERALAEAVDIVDLGAREHYADAALYDYEYRRRRADIAFYRALAEQRLGPAAADTPAILELGCGSGRITIPLARAGYRVVAVDRAPAMLDQLRARVAALPAAVRDRITVVEGDLCTFDVRGRFGLAVAAFNVVEHLYTRVEVDACLRRVRARLAPGGAFAFDVQLPDLAWLIRDPAKRWARTKFTDPSSGRAMIYSTSHYYDPVSQIVVIRLFYDPQPPATGGAHVVTLTQRKFFPAELEALVAAAGMRVAARHGDFYFGPLVAASESQVVIAEAAPARRKR